MDRMKSDLIVRNTPLASGISLQLYDHRNDIIFESTGKWLYPLFEVEDYLHALMLDVKDIFIHDRIAGSAAASLICRMGFRKVNINTISKPALELFEHYGVECEYSILVDKIECRTEDLISVDMDLDHIYLMLRQRAGRLQGIDLEIKGLEAGDEGKKVLKGLYLRMRAGDRLVITGDNGAGKSTLLKTLIGTLSPEFGTIFLGGIPHGRAKKIPSSIGYVNQSNINAGFPVTTEEIVSLGLLGQKLSASERAYQIELAMKRTSCYHLLGRNLSTLSGGEKQRVSLARCLAQKAGLILMDEPTSFLDRESKDEFRNVLMDVVRSHMQTIILVSHDYDWFGRLGWPSKVLKDGVLC